MHNKFIFCLFLSFGLIAGCQLSQRQTAEVSGVTVRREILASNLSFDTETGKIKYTLPEPALVRIRIGIKDGGPLLRTLLDWESRPAGEHTEGWDGQDASGKVDFGKRSDLMIVFGALALNPVHEKEKTKAAPSFKGFRTSPEFLLIFPEAKEITKTGTFVLTGLTPVRVVINKEDKDWLSNTKYEIGLYLDQMYLIEDEEGASPFTYHLDTTHVNDGLHTLTVNVVGFEGEIGTKSVLIFVKNHGSKD